MAFARDPKFSHLSITPTCDIQTNGQTNGRTQDNRKYRDSIASRGQKLSKIVFCPTRTVNARGSSDQVFQIAVISEYVSKFG